MGRVAGQGRVTLKRGAVAVDAEGAADGRQRIGAVPVIVHRREVVGGVAQDDGVTTAGVVGSVDGIAERNRRVRGIVGGKIGCRPQVGRHHVTGVIMERVGGRSHGEGGRGDADFQLLEGWPEAGPGLAAGAGRAGEQSAVPGKRGHGRSPRNGGWSAMTKRNS